MSNANCKSCGAPIKWVQMTSGKRMPLNATPAKVVVIREPDSLLAVAEVVDGYTSHFVDCPQADDHRRAR